MFETLRNICRDLSRFFVQINPLFIIFKDFSNCINLYEVLNDTIRQI
jgi:hypothetical protein